MHDYYLTGSNTSANAFMNGTEAYRATKENVYLMQLQAQNKIMIKLFSNGQQAAKMTIETNGQQELWVMDKWDYWTLSWGNYAGSNNESTTIKGMTVIQLCQ
jgi:hypothetical protein